MPNKYGGDAYITPHRIDPAKLPTIRFFARTLAGPMIWLWQMAQKGRLDDEAWVHGSLWLADIFEKLGGRIYIEGLKNFENSKEPVVIVANHMSTLETFLLPGMIRPIKPVTFVVKKSLTTIPIFGPIMRSRDPVVVERKNPREDLATVLKEGTKRLASGISIIVFPQHTRSLKFDPEQFNSIGIKLASKAGVRVVPLALKTDAWGQGKKIKELGKLRLELPARFKFGKAVEVTGKGKNEHAAICKFIDEAVTQWQISDGINN